MMAEKRKTYTAEIKREAMRLVPEHHYGVAEAARNLGINTTMLRRWKRALADHANGALPGKGRLSPEQEALHRLRAENTRLRMEREI
jgi:transposase